MTTSHQLADQAGITYRQLDNWVRRGWLRPEGSTGSGSDRHWPAGECIVAVQMGKLVFYGVQPALAHDLARAGLAVEVLATIWKLKQDGP